MPEIQHHPPIAAHAVSGRRVLARVQAREGAEVDNETTVAPQRARRANPAHAGASRYNFWITADEFLAGRTVSGRR